MEWRGPRLMNIRLRVCPKCTDVPFIFAKPIIYPPDPMPVYDPRPENFTNANLGSPVVPLPWPVQPIGPPVEPVVLGGGHVGSGTLGANPVPAPPTFSLPPPPQPPPSIFELPPGNPGQGIEE